MAYGSYRGGGGGGYRSGGGGGGGYRGGARSGGAGSAARLTGLFATRKPGLLTGTIDGDQLDGLIDKIKAAKTAGQGIVIFCWENDRARGNNAPVFNLSADVSKPKDDERPAPRAASRPAPPARPGRRRIEEPAPDPVDEAEDGGPEANDDPFA